MNKKNSFLLVAFMLVMFLSFNSCGPKVVSFVDVEIQNENKNKKSDDSLSLQDRKWVLIEQNEKLDPNYLPYIVFENDSLVAGYLGCNRFGSRYELKEQNHIYFSQALRTKMMCENINIEDKLLSDLNKVTQYQINNDTLSLKEGKLVLAKFIGTEKDE